MREILSMKLLNVKYSPEKKLIVLLIKVLFFKRNRTKSERLSKKQNVNKYLPFPIIGNGRLNFNNFSIKTKLDPFFPPNNFLFLSILRTVEGLIIVKRLKFLIKFSI
jgi:hypothetical protein